MSVESKKIIDEMMQKIINSEKQLCSNADQEKYSQMLKNGEPLPDNIYVEHNEHDNRNYFFECNSLNFSNEEQIKYLFLKLVSDTQTIKKCIIFFTIVAVISMIVAIGSLM